MKVGFPFKITGIINAFIETMTFMASASTKIGTLGFVPKIIILLAYAQGGTNQIFSSGFDDASEHRCVYFAGDSVDANHSDTKSVYARKDASNFMTAYVTSMHSDGFWINTALTGTLTVNIVFIALK